MAYIKIGDRGSQRGPRHLRVMTVSGEPHVTQQRRQVVTVYYREMGVSVVPQVNGGAHSLSGSRLLSSSLKHSYSERGASSPTVLVAGSSAAISFPLQREEPSPFVDVTTGYLIGIDW